MHDEATYSVEITQTLSNDLDSLPQIRLLNDQRGSEAHAIAGDD